MNFTRQWLVNVQSAPLIIGNRLCNAGHKVFTSEETPRWLWVKEAWGKELHTLLSSYDEAFEMEESWVAEGQWSSIQS
jgi:hypothetical protein